MCVVYHDVDIDKRKLWCEQVPPTEVFQTILIKAAAIQRESIRLKPMTAREADADALLYVINTCKEWRDVIMSSSWCIQQLRRVFHRKYSQHTGTLLKLRMRMRATLYRRKMRRLWNHSSFVAYLRSSWPKFFHSIRKPSHYSGPISS